MSTPTPTLFDLALREVMTAHGIKRTGLCKVSGQHLSEAPNEPALFSESEMLAADKWRDLDKARSLQARNDDDALQLQVDQMRRDGAL